LDFSGAIQSPYIVIYCRLPTMDSAPLAQTSASSQRRSARKLTTRKTATGSPPKKLNRLTGAGFDIQGVTTEAESPRRQHSGSCASSESCNSVAISTVPSDTSQVLESITIGITESIVSKALAAEASLVESSSTSEASPLLPKSEQDEIEAKLPVSAQLPAEEPAAEQLPADQPTAEQSAAGQLTAEQPAAEQLAAEQPAAEQPSTKQLPADQPAPETEGQPVAEPRIAAQSVAKQRLRKRDRIFGRALLCLPKRFQ